MNLNNIELPASLVADLYSESLVEIGNTDQRRELPAKDQPEKKPEVPGWKTLGENRKQVMIVVDYPGLSFLPDDRLNFLTEILSACKMSLADVAILNLNAQPLKSWKDISKKYSVRSALLFGTGPASLDLPVDFPQFQLQPVANQTFLSSPSLEELEADRVLKSKLWVCLKRLFNL